MQAHHPAWPRLGLPVMQYRLAFPAVDLIEDRHAAWPSLRLQRMQHSGFACDS